jgi:DNA-binding Lrp family transcriptional regulator
MTLLSPLERAVLNRIQYDFPVASDPYAVLADALGASAEAVHAAVLLLRERGIIRRIGGSFDARRLGYVTVLAATRVTPEMIEAVAERINAFPDVTHNYERAGAYNLWFTVISASAARIAQILEAVRQCPGVEVVHALPAERIFKLRVDFQVREDGDA